MLNAPDTSIKRTSLLVPMVSVIEGFHLHCSTNAGTKLQLYSIKLQLYTIHSNLQLNHGAVVCLYTNGHIWDQQTCPF